MANTGQYDSQTNIETEDYEREIFVRPEAAVIYGGSVVNSVNGQVGDVVLTTSDLENTSDYQTGAQVQSAIAGKQDRLTAGTGLNLDGTILSVDTNIIATVQDVTDEAIIRENSDANLQGQIDALTVSSDVIDVLGTYQDLQNYDTSHVKANDIIKVLQDSTHNNSMSYYRWEITDHVGSWVYVGSEGPYYTKSEADALLDSKQNVIVDLPQIRSGAEAGATAVQPEDLARIATTGSYNDSLDKPSINNVVLIGNKSLDALGIQPKGNYALESEIPDVSNFITNTVDNLVNYYKKSETFTKQEVNDLISAITTMDIRVVQTLPTEDISTTTIYFVPKTTAGTNDVYDEYVYVSNAWEHIGSTDIDLSGYQTKIDSSHKLLSDLVDDTNQTNKFVTENEKTTWNTEIYKAFPTDTASGAVASFSDGADNLPLKSLIVNIDPIQDTSQGDPSPENICPISGWSEANVTRTGKNLLALMGANTTDVIPTINETTGEVSIADTTVIKWTSKPFGYSDVVAEQTYIFSATGIKYGRIGGSMNTTYPNVSAGNIPGCTTSGGGITSLVTKNITARTFTPHFTGRIYWHFCTDTDNGSSHQAFTMTPMIELGSTATTYEPYNSNTYTITFPAAAGTVYGGTLDLVSGLLTVNRTTVNITWGSGTNAVNLGHVTRKRFNLDNPSEKYYTDAQNDLKSNVIGQYDTLYSGDYVHMYLASTTHIWAYMPSNTAADTVMQFSYTLETPVTYQLTPTEVTTLLGDNTIWADTGDTEVEYRADTKLYINKMIGDAETISTRLASGGRETALYKGAINPIETNIPLEEEGVEY